MEDKRNDVLVVDDGAVRVGINNQFGDEIGVFYFYPTDIGIIKRFNEVADKFKDVVKPLENVSIGADGKAQDDADVKALTEAENNLFELCNYLFGGDFAKAFFGKMNPFSPVNGKFYAEIALDVVSKYISDKFDAETKKITARVEKYTHGVRTGKHKDGKK